ncbi:hypothetical protein D3C80_2179830 [compost metagenome]
MAEPVVECLEVIHIQHQQGQRRAKATQAAPLAIELTIEVSPVEESGEAVLLG